MNNHDFVESMLKELEMITRICRRHVDAKPSVGDLAIKIASEMKAHELRVKSIRQQWSVL